MYKKILMAVDGSFNAEAAARYAIALSAACKAKLYIASIIPPKMHEKDIRAAEESVKRIIEEAGRTGLDVRPIIEEGKIVPTIKEIVDREKIDMVMAASRKEHAEKRFFVRTVSRELMRLLTCSVIIIRVVNPGKMAYPRDILVPIIGKGYDPTEKVFLTARLARYYKAKTIVLHLKRSITSLFKKGIIKDIVEEEIDGMEDIKYFIDRLKKFKVYPKVRVSYFIKISRTISKEAAAKRHDLIILGATRRSLISQLIRGNPVEEVLRRTPCDLMILKTK